jgi:hypothetical protein
MKLIEISLSNKSLKIFFKIDIETDQIWIDLKGLPYDAFLCAMYDGIEMFEFMCGEKKKTKRMFVSLDWILYKWLCPHDLKNSLKNRKQMLLDSLPEIKKSLEI